jgi:hypothetical protein
LSKALTGTGFLPDGKVRRVQAEVLKHVLPNVRDVRRSGCPSIDICRVASGALDIFYESGLGRWDIAAIAEAAGATVRMLTSNVLPNPFLLVVMQSWWRRLVRCWPQPGSLIPIPTKCDSPGRRPWSPIRQPHYTDRTDACNGIAVS